MKTLILPVFGSNKEKYPRVYDAKQIFKLPLDSSTILESFNFGPTERKRERK